MLAAIVTGFCGLIAGFGFGAAFGLGFAQEAEARKSKYAKALSIAADADNNPEYVPRPPADVERAIGLRQFRRVQNAGRSGVPGHNL